MGVFLTESKSDLRVSVLFGQEAQRGLPCPEPSWWQTLEEEAFLASARVPVWKVSVQRWLSFTSASTLHLC